MCFRTLQTSSVLGPSTLQTSSSPGSQYLTDQFSPVPYRPVPVLYWFKPVQSQSCDGSYLTDQLQAPGVLSVALHVDGLQPADGSQVQVQEEWGVLGTGRGTSAAGPKHPLQFSFHGGMTMDDIHVIKREALFSE